MKTKPNFKNHSFIFGSAPYRLDFCGGPSDLPLFREDFEGSVVNSAISKRVECLLNPKISTRTRVTFINGPTGRKHIEEFDKSEMIANSKYNIACATLTSASTEMFSEIEIFTPLAASSGLGGSAAITASMLSAVNLALGKKVSRENLVMQCMHIEETIMKNSVGGQDQVASVFGGVNLINFGKNGVTKRTLDLGVHEKSRVERNIYYFGPFGSRRSGDIFDSLKKNYRLDNFGTCLRAKRLAVLAPVIERAILTANIGHLGSNVLNAWQIQKSLTKAIRCEDFEKVLEECMELGAIGGKMCGAGNAGYAVIFGDDDERTHNNLIHHPKYAFSAKIDEPGATARIMRT